MPTAHQKQKVIIQIYSQFRVQYLAQGHFDMQTGGTSVHTTELLISGQPTLPLEPQLLSLKPITCTFSLANVSMLTNKTEH